MFFMITMKTFLSQPCPRVLGNRPLAVSNFLNCPKEHQNVCLVMERDFFQNGPVLPRAAIGKCSRVVQKTRPQGCMAIAVSMDLDIEFGADIAEPIGVFRK